MNYSLDPSYANCYEDTTCLINKLDIRDENKLLEVEAQITFAKASILDYEPIEGNFDFEHFKKIHEFLFCDLYDWAGQVRTVNLSKKRTKFTDFHSIKSVANACFNKIFNGYLNDLNFDEFATRIAELYHDINHIHPFREGNGRTERIYFTQLIRHYGYDINFAGIDTDILMIATIHASLGVMDFLIDFFKEAIIEQKMKWN